MPHGSVKLVWRQRIIRAKIRMREPVDVPFDLAGISPHQLTHSRKRVLETLPLFAAAIRDHTEDAILRAELRARLEAAAIDAMLHERNLLAKTPLKLARQPRRVRDPKNRHLERVPAQQFDERIGAPSGGWVGIEAEENFVIVLREVHHLAASALPRGNDGFPVGSDDQIRFRNSGCEQTRVRQAILKLAYKVARRFTDQLGRQRFGGRGAIIVKRDLEAQPGKRLRSRP